MFPPGVKPTSVLVVSGCCHSTLPFSTPASVWNPHYIKTCLISPLPPVRPLTPVLWMNHWGPLAHSWCCLRARDAELSAWKEHPLSWIIFMSSYFINTQYAWLQGLQESPQLSQYVIICYPIYRYSGSILWDLFNSCMRIKWSSGA